MDIERNTPSSKIIALAIVVVAIVVASWVIKKGGENKSPSESPRLTVSGDTSVYVNETDTDGDGLKDWEESLWGFNPNLADTDGDGITDAAEKTTAQQEMLTRQEEFARLLDPTQDPNWESMSYTEQVSGLILTEYLTLKQSGQPLTKDDALSIVENLPSYSLPKREEPEQFGVADIRISSASDEDALHAYGNDVGSVIAVPKGDTAPNELLVLMSFLQTGDEETFLHTMQEITARYDSVISGLLALEVPQGIVAQHLAVLNALSFVRNDIRDFNSFTQDPFLALSVFTAYNESTARRGEAFTALRDALENAGVEFSDSEPGHVLFSAVPSSS